ncbi:DNA repair protein RecN [Collibacillus ludicampi]|uniref:DNA repair protein RecN n=1 Tax=Collibacillus ludicampi TaxID=2771369 RepID=UPI00249401B7|nr:DNA repair protein RecN [Collibacillus ludicampi]
MVTLLQELFIRNFALIEEVRLTFDSGLTILTGETGAGKSIILDALGLIVGGRASSEMVRQGAEKAIIEALFIIDQNRDAWLQLFNDMGFEWNEDDTLVVTREVSASGKNVCRVNGRIVTVQMLRQIGKRLLDIVGQHENQSLLRVEDQLDLLDAFGGSEISALRREVSDLYHRFNDARRVLRDAQLGEKERMQRIDILRFQMDEIDAAGFTPGEDVRLEEERRMLAHAEKLYASAANAYAVLYQGSERQHSILDLLYRVLQDLETAERYDASLAPIVELIKTAGYQLEEAAHDLRSYRDTVESNPARLRELEERIALLSRLQKKYGENVEAILQYAEKIRTELYELENHEEHIVKLQQELEKIGKQLAEKALLLSEKRKEVAEDLSELVMGELTNLMMPKTQFAIHFQEFSDADGICVGNRWVHVSETGIDRIEFLFSPNIGEPLRPLAKIASGGELSRTMLALTTLLSDVAGVQTLVFDEVDTGISGRAAQAVAEKLSIVSETKQVICVTHLPQVACMADTHYQIVKHQTGQRTYTEVTCLSEEERIEELARMLSGPELTDTTRKAAEEMLRLARLVKTG